jgi:hypothetical protein
LSALDSPPLWGYTLDSGLTLTPPTWYLGFHLINPYVMAVKVADTVSPPATLNVQWTDPLNPLVTHTLAISVVAPPTSPMGPYLVPPASSYTDITMGQSNIQAAIDAGYSPIYLSAGDYPITSSFDQTGPYVAPIVTIDGQNWASLTADPVLGSSPIFNVTKPLNLKRLAFHGSILNLSQNVLGVPGTAPAAPLDININLCRFVDIFLGGSNFPQYDPDAGGSDPYGTGMAVERCEFVRATTGPIPTGSVFALPDHGDAAQLRRACVLEPQFPKVAGV